MAEIAHFRIDDARPGTIVDLEADWVNVTVFTKTFTSGIIGGATTVFMSAGAEEGSRSYVATERISGRIGEGADGEVVVQHGGLESDPHTWFGNVVPNSGSGSFAGWSGTARIRHDDDGAYFEFDLDSHE